MQPPSRGPVAWRQAIRLLEERSMPLDVGQTGLGLEIALLRALGDRRRRRSLADRLLRERRGVKSFASVRGGK